MRWSDKTLATVADLAGAVAEASRGPRVSIALDALSQLIPYDCAVLEESQLDRVRKLVESGATPRVSGFVQHAVAVSLDDVAGWGAMLAEALLETGGPLTGNEREWADDVLGVKKALRRSVA